ncbi:putative RNA polymerase, sigma-24 subunit, ECF subfamily [Shewanella benthica]|uniref:Putative RNA polymerase, sigma-24 subunit, ECF subfamily n=1 Tax=Shewanella benthica TaxID=43661 RepID=A0A330M6D2_9GAMM|nr:putative RNA polymerase, sigma-24 subunit, ECF subfamily [Shewanella benthica]
MRLMASTDQDFEQLTSILVKWNSGSKAAEHQLYQFAYQKFRDLASEVKSNAIGGRPESTFLHISCNTTSLVHDAFIRINQSRDIAPETTRELYVTFSNVIYSILVDNIRKSQAKKRQRNHVATEENISMDNIQRIFDIEILLKKLALEYSRQVSIFIYKYVCLMPSKEIAGLFSISESTVDKDLSFIKIQLSSYYHD